MRYNWKLPIIVICVVLISILGMTFIVQGPKNTAISYEEQIQEAKSGIGNQEKRRADLIPNLVETVKAYDQHEYQTLMDVVNARGTSGQTAQEITTQIAAIAEAYPELKSTRVIWFWVFWVVLMVVAVGAFYVAENRWLED